MSNSAIISANSERVTVRFNLKLRLPFHAFIMFFVIHLAGFQPLLAREFANLNVLQEINEYNRNIAETAPDGFADKLAAMSTDLFAFMRGTAHIMNKDLQISEKLAPLRGSPAGLVAGDLHMHNFSIICQPGKPAAYAIDDLDEASEATPLSFDVFRLAVSLLAGFDQQALTADEQSRVVRAVLDGYRARSADTAISDWPAVPDSAFIKAFIADESDVKWSKFIKKRTTGEVPNRFDMQRFEQISESEAQQVKGALTGYLAGIAGAASISADACQILDISQRTDKGLASIGLKRYFALLQGNTAANDDDIILELKEMRAGSLAGGNLEQQRNNTIEAMKRAHQSFDPFLGTGNIASKSFLIKQVYPWSETIEYDSVQDREHIFELARALGFICADFHAASNQGAQMTAWVASSTEQIVPLAIACLAQLKTDYKYMLEGQKHE